jgi:BirA family biotin operon repressor/biotin-[acetyl-CoA-carboxylase] ligase
LESLNKDNILKLLQMSRGYISGQSMCEKFNCSRTAIWKKINKLRREGYVIDSITNKGYKLVGSPNSLKVDEITERLVTEGLDYEIKFFGDIDSTNLEIKRQAENGGKDGLVVISERQTEGRGRRGRDWSSESTGNVYMSILLRPEMNPNKAPMITLIMGAAVNKALNELTGANVYIKWPNDIIIHGKKLAGILTEMILETDYINFIVIGVGINVLQDKFDEEIANKASSVFLETELKIDRAELIVAVLKEFNILYKQFLEVGNLSFMMPWFNDMLITRHKQVRVISGPNETTGVSLGVDEEGELLVETKDGVEKFRAGEISIRGMDGYI